MFRPSQPVHDPTATPKELHRRAAESVFGLNDQSNFQVNWFHVGPQGIVWAFCPFGRTATCLCIRRSAADLYSKIPLTSLLALSLMRRCISPGNEMLKSTITEGGKPPSPPKSARP